MYQLVEQLNIALADVKGIATGQSAGVNQYSSTAAGGSGAKAQADFNSVKDLIIKSADIVNAYYEKIRKRLEGRYVAESDFGIYTEQTASEIHANSIAIEQMYTNIQTIISDIDNLEHSLIDVDAFIKSGVLGYDDYGAPVYGIEIGQRTEIDGEEVFNKYARFTSSKLSFYDSNDNEVAYISDKKLYITNVEVTGSFSLGGFVDTVLPDRSVVTRWVEGGA
jgi:hypothetical protein